MRLAAIRALGAAAETMSIVLLSSFFPRYASPTSMIASRPAREWPMPAGLLAPSGAAAPAEVLARAQLELLARKDPSVTTGKAFGRGALVNAAQLPLEGPGYFQLRPERGVCFGTDDLVGGLMESAASLAREAPEAPPLAVGDLSRANGGRVSLHISHRSGRDADLLYFWTDAKGRPRLSEEFLRFDAAGRARLGRETVLFDAPRNWALVKALLTNARFGGRVSVILVAPHLRRLLLEHAERSEPDRALVRRARLALQHARAHEGPHDDHLHLRIACSAEEASRGCRD